MSFLAVDNIIIYISDNGLSSHTHDLLIRIAEIREVASMHEDMSRQISIFLHPSFEGYDTFVCQSRRRPFALRFDEECEGICTVSRQETRERE